MLASVLFVLGIAVALGWWNANRRVTVEFPVVANSSLEIALNASQIETQPGTTQRLIYRVTNPNAQPQRLIVNLQYEPKEAEDWLRIFQTDCRKWILIKPGETVQLETVFTVVPSLLRIPSHATLRSIFQTL
ncbi:MAG: cytochrome c oxidase assembly protein [Caldilineaceae bacterium]